MPNDYVELVRQLDWQGLRRLWDRIEAGATGWPGGKALEHLVLRAFELSGATVIWPYSVPIGGEVAEQIDGVVFVDSLSCLIECKDTAEPTRVEVVAKLRNQLLRRHGAVIGALFSRTGFTPSAIALAQFLAPQTILLWTGDEIAYLLEQEDVRAALLRKYRYSVETGFPEYNLWMEAAS